MIHFGCLGYSPRTTSEGQVVRFGAELLRVETDVLVSGGPVSVEIGYRPGEPKRVSVNGAAERSVERLLERFPVLVFTPDRLRLVQGAPALRRAYFDRVLARLWPAPAAASAEYARRLSQRNHLLRRVRAGRVEPGALDPWDRLLAEAGEQLIAARARLCTRLAGPFAGRLGALGGDPGEDPLRYRPNVEPGRSLEAALIERRGRDIDRAVTGAGPHLDDVLLFEHDRDLRLYGSQGEQRRALLGLILAEADLLVGGAGRAAAAAARRRHRRARRRAAAAVAGGGGRLRPGHRHHHRSGRPGRRACLGADGERREGGGVNDLRPIRDDVRRLGRVPEVDSQVLEARRVWREAVGEQVAANSLPVRRSGDALIVHCASSGWASELTLLERQMRSRLEALMDPPPARLRFEVGDVDVPETVVSADQPAAAIEPSDDQRAQARALAADISDPDLRRAAERAIAAGLARDS